MTKKYIPEEWKVEPLLNYLDYDQPTNYIIETKISKEKLPIPVLTPGKTFIKGYVDEKKGIYDSLPVIIFDDFTTAIKWVNFPFKVKSSAMKILKPRNKDVNMKFIFYQMSQIDLNISTHKRHYLSIYQNLEFVFPDTVTQEKIVEEIEKQFSRLDESEKELKDVERKLSLYRKAVLKKVFEIREGWEEKVIGELFDFLGGGTPSKKNDSYWSGNIPWASVKDIKNHYLDKTKDHITKEGLDNSSANIAKKGEVILITRISPGKVSVSNIETAVNQDLKIIKPILNLENNFIYYLFKSIENECIKLSSGTTVLGINLENLKSIPVPFPKLKKEREEIVQEIEQKFSIISFAEKEVEESLKEVERLRKSILKSAFGGRLIK